LPAEHLSRLARDVTQPGEYRSGSRQQPVLTSRRRQLTEARAQHKPALQIPANQTMVLQGNGKSMGGRSGEPSGCH
jgi:hypothetical protein